jgi:hypothetical protein
MCTWSEIYFSIGLIINYSYMIYNIASLFFKLKSKIVQRLEGE